MSLAVSHCLLPLPVIGWWLFTVSSANYLPVGHCAKLIESLYDSNHEKEGRPVLAVPRIATDSDSVFFSIPQPWRTMWTNDVSFTQLSSHLPPYSRRSDFPSKSSSFSQGDSLKQKCSSWSTAPSWTKDPLKRKKKLWQKAIIPSHAHYVAKQTSFLSTVKYSCTHLS